MYLNIDLYTNIYLNILKMIESPSGDNFRRIIGSAKYSLNGPPILISCQTKALYAMNCFRVLSAGCLGVISFICNKLQPDSNLYVLVVL